MNQRSGRPWLWPAFVITLLVVTMAGSLSVLWIANMDGGVQLTQSYVTQNSGAQDNPEPDWIVKGQIMDPGDGNPEISIRVVHRDDSEVVGLSIFIESGADLPADTHLPIRLTEDADQAGMYTAVVPEMTKRETDITVRLTSKTDTLHTQTRLLPRN